MSKQEEFARMWGKLLSYAARRNIQVVTYSLHRTVVQQARLFRKRLSHCDGVDIKSKHQRGRAGDLAVLEDGDCVWGYNETYERLGKYWEKLGGVWGHRWFERGRTRFDDCYHFEV